MAITKRCGFCLKPLREDGTCANPKCPRYVEEAEPEKNTEETEEEDK